MNQYLTVWGTNSENQLNIPYLFNSGENNLKSGFENITKVSLGYDHGVLQYIANDGNKYLKAWGQNYFGENNINPNFFYKNFDAGINTTYTVDNYGRIHAYGLDAILSDVSLYSGEIINWAFSNPDLFPNNGGLPSPLKDYELNIDSVSAGSGYVIALTIDGKITGWGNSGNPVISGKKYTGINALGFVTGISAGYEHALALLSNGIITGWGNNSYGQLNFNTGVISGVKVATKSYDNLFMGCYYPIITGVKTGLFNTNFTGWIINYIGTGKNITGINIERSLNLIDWTGDFKTGFKTLNTLTGSGYQLDNNNYYIRLITSNISGEKITGAYSIFNPNNNLSKIGGDYKIYYDYKPNINNVWKKQESWKDSVVIFNQYVSGQELSQILFNDNGEKQLIYRKFDIFHSIDSGNSWRFKANTVFDTGYYLSGVNLSWSPNGNTLNSIFYKDYPLFNYGDNPNDFSSQGLVLFDTNFNNINNFSSLTTIPISYSIDESQQNGDKQNLWIQDYSNSSLTFGFKFSHLSNLYSVLIGDSGTYDYYDNTSTLQTLNFSGRLVLFENWKTGIYTGYFIDGVTTGRAFVYSLNNRYNFPLYACSGSTCLFPDPFFERTATFKNSGYYTGNNLMQNVYWKIAKITDNKKVYGVIENNQIGKHLAYISFQTGIFQNYDANYFNNFSGKNLNIYRNNKNWVDLDISEDGKYQTAIANTGLSGYIYITENSGQSWKEVGLYSGNFNKVKVSKNGKYQILLKETGNNVKDIYSSNDYGNNWYQHNFYDNWIDIAVANNGLQSVINKDNIYYNYFQNYNENYLQIKNNKILDIAAGYSSNLILTDKVLSGNKISDSILDYIEDNTSIISDYSSAIIENSWYESSNGIYRYINNYNNKPAYFSTGDFNGNSTNNFIRWDKNRWNIYYNYDIIIYYSTENTFYPWEVTSWSGLTTGVTGTFKQMNPYYYYNTGYTGGNFGTIKKYTPIVPDGQIIGCSGYIFDE